MKKLAIASVAGAVALAGCATDPYDRYGYDDRYYDEPRSSNSAKRAARGAVVGAAGGAILGAVVDGVSVEEGAIGGAAVGALAGLVIDGKRYYRDRDGYCYTVDKRGRRDYDYDVRC